MNAAKLKQIFTTASEEDIQAFLFVFLDHAKEYNIVTKFQENAFLAQILAEVGSELKSVRENLNYSCAGLKNTFGFYKKHPHLALKHGRCNGHSADQQAIGNHAYAERIGNGDVSSGDGFKFRGGGFFQLTGRANYERIAQQLPVRHTAEELERDITEVDYGLISAMAFWRENHMDKATHIDETTAIINKHTNSYAKREKAYLGVAGINV